MFFDYYRWQTQAVELRVSLGLHEMAAWQGQASEGPPAQTHLLVLRREDFLLDADQKISELQRGKRDR